MRLQAVLFYCLSLAVYHDKSAQGFVPMTNKKSVSLGKADSSSSTPARKPLRPLHNKDGGFDPSGILHWSPSEAAEFVIWHTGKPQDTGRQLANMILHWRAQDLAEFLTRIYLGEPNQRTYAISFHSRNVRDPKWKGFDAAGIEALCRLLSYSIPNHLLEPQEVARVAETFLLSKHSWSSDDPLRGTEWDSFANRGFAKGFGMVLGSIRTLRLGPFRGRDVVMMLGLPEKKDKSENPLQLTEFYKALDICLSPREKDAVVCGLVAAQWKPTHIARFINLIKELPEIGITRRNPNDAIPMDGPEIQKQTNSTGSSTFREAVAAGHGGGTATQIKDATVIKVTKQKKTKLSP